MYKRQALDNVGHNIQSLRYNVAVAQIYEFANTLQASLAKPASEGMDWALRESGELLIHMTGPMMPHLAEECWVQLGYHTLLADEAWPEAEAALLVDDTITIAVQVNGKRRDELTIPHSASKEDVEKAALALEAVQRALKGRSPKKVIVVPQRIVNVVG